MAILRRRSFENDFFFCAEQMKTNERELRKVDRDVERDRRGLEREEKNLETEIKKAVKQGNKQAATVLAKQLVQMRKQKTRTYVVQSQVRGANSQSKVMGANVKLAESMGQTTKVMGQMNKMVDPQKMAKTMMEFERENAKMEMTEETSEHTLEKLNVFGQLNPLEKCFKICYVYGKRKPM